MFALVPSRDRTGHIAWRSRANMRTPSITSDRPSQESWIGFSRPGSALSVGMLMVCLQEKTRRCS